MIPVFALALLVNPWASMECDMYMDGFREGASLRQIQEWIRYTKLINKRAGWITPERRKR